MNVDVIPIVIVIANVMVIPLGNGNDTVLVFAKPATNTTARSTRRYPPMLHFQKLDVYQRSIEFLILTRRIREQLPKGNAEVSDQLRRAAQSIPQNIAEGCGRATRADKARHYTIARGSAMESAAHLDVMRADELIDAAEYDQGTELLERIVAMLTKMIEP